ncbi:MAG: acyl carrier protein [Opitutaceae bacterium]|nr:acyl carrier protein [Opitutaceae bacterium]
MDQVRNEVEQVFRNVFGDDELVLRDAMTADDVEGWDSLTHINLIIALEKRFGIKFATAEISRMKEPGQNVGHLIASVAAKRR